MRCCECALHNIHFTCVMFLSRWFGSVLFATCDGDFCFNVFTATLFKCTYNSKNSADSMAASEIQLLEFSKLYMRLLHSFSFDLRFLPVHHLYAIPFMMHISFYHVVKYFCGFPWSLQVSEFSVQVTFFPVKFTLYAVESVRKEETHPCTKVTSSTKLISMHSLSNENKEFLEILSMVAHKK